MFYFIRSSWVKILAESTRFNNFDATSALIFLQFHVVCFSLFYIKAHNLSANNYHGIIFLSISTFVTRYGPLCQSYLHLLQHHYIVLIFALVFKLSGKKIGKYVDFYIILGIIRLFKIVNFPRKPLHDQILKIDLILCKVVLKFSLKKNRSSIWFIGKLIPKYFAHTASHNSLLSEYNFTILFYLLPRKKPMTYLS